MKRCAVILSVILAAVCVAGAADNKPVSYFSGYKFVSATTTNTGTTGLIVSNAYLCFPLSVLAANCTAAQAATNGDVRAVMYSIVQEFNESYDASTNKTATTISRGTTYASSGTNVSELVTHIIRTTRQFGSAILP